MTTTRKLNWPAFWHGFVDGLALAAWQLVFPTIGLLWVVGWLA